MCLYTYYSFILFLFQISFQNLRSQCVGRDSSVGIATRYRLDGPGIESRWGGQIVRALGTTQPPIQWVPGLS